MHRDTFLHHLQKRDPNTYRVKEGMTIIRLINTGYKIADLSTDYLKNDY